MLFLAWHVFPVKPIIIILSIFCDIVHVLNFSLVVRNLTPAERQSLQVKEEVGPCLVVVARLQHFGDSTPRKAASTPENEFVARIGTDGRFTYVDPR